MAEFDEAEKRMEDEADIDPEREASAGRTAAAIQSSNEAIWHEESEAAEAMEMERERLMGELLKRCINIHKHIQNLQRSGRSVEKIIAALKNVKIDLEKIKVLKSKGFGKCIKREMETEDFQKFAREHCLIRNKNILGVSKGIVEVMIEEDTAQEMYELFTRYITRNKINNLALFGVLKWCLDKGAQPERDEICQISLLVGQCKTPDALLANLKITEQLICTYRRKQCNTEPIAIYLNPMQNQWQVSEDLRTVASAVIRAAYGTIDNCMKSESVINILAFLSDDDNNIIEKCFEEANVLLQRDTIDPPVSKWFERQHRDDSDILLKRNDNWLKRSLLHLAAIFCHDEDVLKCIPKELIKREIEARDLHDCTPLHMAHLHGNKSAITFLVSHNATIDTDNFGRSPQSFNCPDNSKALYEEYCGRVMNTKSSVLRVMKQMLILPIDEGETIAKDLTILFERMVAKDGFLNAKIKVVGSVKERLKVGRFDEFDLQIISDIKPFADEPFACLRLHEYLVKRISEINQRGIRLRCVSVGNPWLFVWEGGGSCNGLMISVDVVPVWVEDNDMVQSDTIGQILDNSPCYPTLVVHLKWKIMEEEPAWNLTICMQEWDILQNLPQGCRLGILICKALLEAEDKTRDNNDLDNWITSYMVKNTLLWILAARTPEDMEKIHNGNFIGRRYSALRQKLHFSANGPKWTTEDDLDRFAEDGRFWAEKIFDAIQFLVHNYEMMLVGSFLNVSPNGLRATHEVVDVLDICERCLERLRPQIFFNEFATAFAAGTSKSDSGLRTKLQEVIKVFNKNSETALGAVFWKMKKDVKELKFRMDDIDNRFRKQIKEGQCNDLEKEIEKLRREHGSEKDRAILRRKERECDELDREIDNVIEKLGQANRIESVLCRKRGECEELEREVGKNSLVNFQLQPGMENDAALIEKRRECEELEKEVNELRDGSRSRIEKLEKMMDIISQTDTTQIDEFLSPSEKLMVVANVNTSSNMKRQCETDASSETLQPPGYDYNDVLEGGELDIATMDKYALLCRLPAPSHLHLQAMSPSPKIPATTPSESFIAIHCVDNHFVVSSQKNGFIVLYDSLYDNERIEQALSQLKCLYQVGIDAYYHLYIVPQSQDSALDSCLHAAANATMLIRGIDPCTVTLDTSCLRKHLLHCLQTEQVKLFPCVELINTDSCKIENVEMQQHETLYPNVPFR